MDNNKSSGYFKTLHDDLHKNVDENIVDKFASLPNNVERVKFLCDLPAFKSCNLKSYLDAVDGGKFPVDKDAAYARGLKGEGNAAVQKGDWLKALEFYSKSYINMPRHLREDISIVLANRSAALYHLNQWELCLDDIIRAIEFDYPRRLRHKIMERKARCLLAVNRNDEATDAFKGTIASLDAADMPTEKKQKLQKDCQIMIEVLTKGKLLSGPDTPKSEPLIKKPPKAKLTGKCNKRYPALSESVDVDKNEEKGRFVVATKDIAAGETVLVEKPFSKVLLNEFGTTHCQLCFTRASVPIACPKCPNVVFCSDKCQKQALNGFHGYECPVLPLINLSGCSITCHLALRIVTQTNLDDIKKYIANQKGDVDVYKSDDLVNLHNLVGHEDKRSKEDLFHRAEMAALLLKILDLTGFFSGKPRETPIKDEDISTMDIANNEWVDKLGEILLKNLQILQFNAHEVFELQCQKPPVGSNVLKHKGKSVFIGGAVFNTLSLFNHSCDPGIARYFHGDTIVVRTVKNISKGEEVSENYGPIFTNVPKAERQNVLKQQYWFDCRCKPCEQDWPLYKDMNENYMRFKCNSEKPCPNVLAVPHDCSEIIIKCDLCQQHTSILKGLKALQDTDVTVQEGKTLMDAGKYGEAIKKFTQVLKLYDSTLAPPYHSYYECVQHLRTCLLSVGNYSVLN